jgi:simple sugar transport system ATP-binding protein
MTAFLEMRGVTKEYRGIAAIKNINFQLKRGEVHALLGENGAGKSTLTKMMAGVATLSAGKMLLEGKEVSFDTPGQALAAGIVMVFQETSLVPSMTVAQNLYLGEEKTFNRLRNLYIEAQQFLQTLNFNVDPWAAVSKLGAAKRQMVEIARAVRQNARLIIFDEPTATLTPEEKSHFFSLVERLKARAVTIIFISHALEEALNISDAITILRDGELVASGPTADFDRAKIIRHMVGRTLSENLYRSKGTEVAVRKPGRKILSVQGLSMGSIVHNNSFSIYSGQVTGMFGLIGSGRTETAKVIAGVLKRNLLHGGSIIFDDVPVRYRVPAQAVADGIAYVTEDRKVEGYFESMSIAENIYLRMLASLRSNLGLVRKSEMNAVASDWSKRLSIRAIDSNANVIELSGGNQQKVVIAGALAQKPKLVIFDEPTRGVDVGAIAEIHATINDLANQGVAVMVISSYLPEIMNISDRILVCRAGRIVEEFDVRDATEEGIMYAAVH